MQEMITYGSLEEEKNDLLATFNCLVSHVILTRSQKNVDVLTPE